VARSRRRRDLPRQRSLSFKDPRDSHRGQLTDWGASPNYANRQVAPSPSVHRLLRSIARSSGFLPGYGAGKPHVAFSPVPTRHVAPSAIVRLPGVRYPLPPASQKTSASWRDFNVVRFPFPKTTTVCIRRKSRREVLHALGVAGRRGLGLSGVHRTPDSSWRC